MLTKIIDDHGQRYAKDCVLDPKQPVTIETSIDSGLTALITLYVSDINNSVLDTRGFPDPLSTGDVHGGVLTASFDLSKYPTASYINWTIWGSNPNPPTTSAGQCKVTVNAIQGPKKYPSYRAVELPIGQKILAWLPDGLWIGAAK